MIPIEMLYYQTHLDVLAGILIFVASLMGVGVEED